MGISVNSGFNSSIGLSVGNGISAGGGLSSNGFGAALDLNFLSGRLDPRITFSRTSNATLTDSTGKITFAPNNLLLNSATLSTQTVSTGFNAGDRFVLSFSGTGSVAISGGYTGTLAGTGVSDRVSLSFSTTTTSLTFTVTGSVTSAQLERVTYQTTPSIYNATTTAAYYGPRFDYDASGVSYTDVVGPELVANGDFSSEGTGWTFPAGWSVSGGGAVATATNNGLYNGNVQVTTGKTYKIEFDITSYTSGTLFVTVGGNTTTPFSTSFTGRKTCYVVAGSNVSRGVEFYGGTISATIDNVSVKELIGQYQVGTAFPKGLLIEEARTNLLLQSQTFDSASWTKTASGTGSAPVVTANADLAPDGTMTADLVAFNRGAGNTLSDRSVLSQSLSASDNVNVVGSVYLKAATAGDIGKTIAVRTASGGAYVEVTLTANWVRFSNTGTTTARTLEVESRGTISASNSVSLLIWGAQLEVGAFATSYIPTVASTVARSADLASMTGTNFSSWFNQGVGTFYGDYSIPAYNTSVNQVLLRTDGSDGLSIRAADGAGAGSRFLNSSTNLDISIAGYPAVGSIVKLAAAYGVNDAAFSRNGSVPGTDTSYTSIGSVTFLNLGRFSDSAWFLNGYIRSIRYYRTRLPNDQIRSLTR